MKSQLLSSMLIAMLCLSGCQKPSEKSEQAVPQTTEKPQEKMQEEVRSKLPDGAPFYKVATITSYEPYMLQDEFGKPTGFQVDLLKAVAEHAQIGLNFSIMPWSDVFDAIAEEEKDIVIAVIIKPERDEFLDFTQPTIDSVLAFMAKGELAIKNFDEILQDKTLKFAVIEGSRAQELLVKSGIPSENVLSFPTQFESVKSLAIGNVDAVLEDKNTLKFYQKTYADKISDAMIIEREQNIENMAFAVKEGNTEVLKKLEEGLASVKADGTYDKIYQKWFGE